MTPFRTACVVFFSVGAGIAAANGGWLWHVNRDWAVGHILGACVCGIFAVAAAVPTQITKVE